MKLCKDCRWIETLPPTFAANMWMCANPRYLMPGRPDFVTGQPPKPHKRYAWDARDDRDACGPEGNGFEPREPDEPGFGT
jgi:hypothetical protein